MNRFILLLFFVFFCDNAFAQQPSLELAEVYRVNQDYERAISTAKEMLQIYTDQKNTKGAVKALVVLNNVYANMGDYKEAVQFEEEAIKKSFDSNDLVTEGYAFLAKANTQYAIDAPDKVVANCNLALSKIGTHPEYYLLAKIYILLYSVHSSWNHIKETNVYANKALENALLSGDLNLVSNSYFAVSVANDNNYNASKSEVNLRKIVAPLDSIISLHEKNNGKVSPKVLALAYMNRADYYFNHFPEQDVQARKMALDNVSKVLTTCKAIRFNQELIASSYGLMSEYSMRDNNIAQAETHLLNAYKVMHSRTKVYSHTMLNVINALVGLYEKKNNFEQALEFQKETTEYSKKLFNSEQVKNSQRLEVQFETEKKSSAIKLLEEKEMNLKRRNYLLGGLVVVALIGIFFMFRSYNYRLKYSLEREKKLNVEKQEAELLIKLHQEKHERLEAEQNLLNYQQKQLQQKAMTSALHLEHKNELLKSLKNGVNVDIQKILREENLLDIEFEKAMFRIQETNPGFFNMLNAKTQQKLTALDLKYCAYIHLGMDVKQIATLLNVEPKSVRMTKYRLKVKLNLEKDIELGEFLRDIG